MTTPSERDEKEAAKEARAARAKEIEAEEVKLNAGKTGKGLRFFIGLSKGKNPQKVQYEGFDESQPDTLPVNMDEFMTLTGVDSEPVIMSYVIDGYNSAQLATAADPSNEFVDASWPLDVQKQFKAAVKNAAAASGVSIEDMATILKPSIDKRFKASA